MIEKYIKSPDGRGVFLGDSNIIKQARDKEELQAQIQVLQNQIDKLQERLLRLEEHHKD